MNWSKAKNIILLLLLMINIFLLVTLISKHQIYQGALQNVGEDVSRILAEYNIKLSPSLVDTTVLRRRPLIISRAEKEEKLVSEGMLGAINDMESPGGGIRRYTSDTGTATWRAGATLTITLSEGGPELKPGISSGAAVQYTLDYLLKAGLDVFAGDMSAETVADTVTVNIAQRVGGYRVFNTGLTVRASTGGSNVISGLWAFGETRVSGDQYEQALSGLLIKFARNVREQNIPCGKITALTGGYIMRPERGGVCLYPVWRLETDFGERFINAMNGEIMAVEQ